MKQLNSFPSKYFPLSSVSPFLLLVFAIGLAVRCLALANIEIINPDGVLYIYQAKAIANGQWHLINQCQLPYLSAYPLLIAFFQLFVSQWVLSAQLVSLCFGFAMLVVLYLLLRQFFNDVVSQLTTLLFAFLPVLVRYSVDVMRDSTFWFFFTASILLFVLHIRQQPGSKKSLVLLTCSSCLILLAAWSRIEGLILLPASCLYIVIAHGGRKSLRLLMFLLPEICLAGAIWLLASVNGSDILNVIRLDDVAGKFYEPVASYQTLRADLKNLAGLHWNTLLGEFLQNSYHNVWLIALCAMFSNMMESFFYPYIPFFMVGAFLAGKQLNRQSAFLYPLLILIFSFFLLFVHTLQTWIMTYRFIVLLIIPACVLAGLGVEQTIRYMTGTFKMKEKKAIAVVAFFIVAVALFNNISPIESDKAVYTRIGSRISQLAADRVPVGIAGKRSVVHMWISFYANAASATPVCHQAFTVEPTSIADLKSMMQSKGLSYFLWEESAWRNTPFGRNDSDFFLDFEELGRWHHHDPGTLVLFRLKASK